MKSRDEGKVKNSPSRAIIHRGPAPGARDWIGRNYFSFHGLRNAIARPAPWHPVCDLMFTPTWTVVRNAGGAWPGAGRGDGADTETPSYEVTPWQADSPWGTGSCWPSSSWGWSWGAPWGRISG